MGWMFDNVVRLIARPQKPANPCELFTPNDSTARYPILPKITRIESETARREIAENRHSSLYELRDFDISPYFMMVKPTLARDFNHKDMHWAVLSSGSHRRGSSEATMANPAAQVRCRCRSLHESMAGERDAPGAASVTCSWL
jgi:hypothetical protein